MRLQRHRLLSLAVLLAITLALRAQTTWSTGAYVYDGAGNIKSIGTDQYRYDAFGRLLTATVGPGHSQSATYDTFGNIRTLTTNGLTQSFGVDPSSNQLTVAIDPVTQQPYQVFGTYDDAGRLTVASGGVGNSFDYDNADMVTRSTVEGTTRVHLYTVNDERIASVTFAGGVEAGTEWTLRDPAGKVLRRVDQHGSQWSWKEDYIYHSTGLLAAEVDTPARTLHFFPDHLGTPRLITGNGGTKVALHTYLPFGEEVTPPAQNAEKLKFTGHERDAASLDYMHARYYAPKWGRFLSVDPAYDFERVIRNPQGWNRYSYVENSPTNFTDPNGKCINVAACAWQVGRWLLPMLAREAGSATVGTLRTGTQMYAMQRLSGMTYAQPVVVPIGLAGAQSEASEEQNSDADTGAQDKKLTGAEIDALETGSGESAHDIKRQTTGDKNVSKYDLYKDKDGNIYVKPKNNPGRGEPTGYNINDFFRDRFR